MKATKKIVGAACALVAAVALSAGSTFAWFTSNGTVTANGLEVKVKTDNAYLVIADQVANLSKGYKTLDLSAVSGGDSVVELKASAYKTATVSDPETEGGNQKVEVSDTGIIYQDQQSTDNAITNPATWYTGQGTSATDGALSGEVTKLTSFTDYVVVANMFVSVLGSTAVNTVEMSMEKTLTDADKSNDALTVLVLYRYVSLNDTGSIVEPETPVDWKHTEVTCAASSTLQDFALLGDGESLTEKSVVQIKVMVYFDGNSSAVTTSNQVNLTGATFNFTFTDGSDSMGS